MERRFPRPSRRTSLEACHRVAPGNATETLPLMKSLKVHSSVCLVFASLVACCVLGQLRGSSAQESTQSRALFNGKDLTGWVTPEDLTMFTVEGGEIVGRT